MLTTIRKYPITSFLVINYLISWSFLYPSYQLILKNDEITPLALIGLIGAYGPSIAAIIVIAITDRSKLKDLFRKIIQVKTGLWTLLFLITIPILLYSAAHLISLLAFKGDINFNFVLGISGLPFWFLAALPFGPMGEELGWRGYMLPKLLEKYSIEKSTILVGLAWGVWHLASFTFPGAAIPDFFDVTIWTVLLYFANTIALSFIYTYVYFKTNGSVFYAILLHAFFNAASNITLDLFGETTSSSILISAYILNIAFAGVGGFLLIKRHEAILDLTK